MNNRPLENTSPQMQEIMRLLGLGDKEVLSFTLRVRFNERPELDVTHYPGNPEAMGGTITETFVLTLK